MQSWLCDVLCCPACDGPLQQDGDWLVCGRGCTYPVIEGIPVFLEEVPLRTEPQAPRAEEPPQIDAVASLVARHAGALNLDVGCGTGRNLGLFEGQYVGCDPDFTALRAARQRGDEGHAAFVCCDGRSLPFQSGTFDFVLSAEVIEHVSPDDRRPFVDELRRVLGPAGAVVVSAPLDTAVGNGLAAIARRLGLLAESAADTHPRTTVPELRELGFAVRGCLDSPAKRALTARGLGPLATLYDRGVRRLPQLSTHCVGVDQSHSS